MSKSSRKVSKKRSDNVIIFPGSSKELREKEIGKEELKSPSRRRHKSVVILSVILIAVLAALAAGGIYILEHYKVSTVRVEGNIHYTSEEIIEMVTGGRFGRNSLYLSMKYKDKSIEGIPFIQKMDVLIEAPDTIKIMVYEKAIAGYVEYLENYLYFDKDGIVVESSRMPTSGVPQVTGLRFDYIILHEKLPVESEQIFSRIMNITQIVNKYNIMVDKIHFGAENEITLYFEEVKVSLGTGDNLEEKVMALQYMLPSLEGKKGTLRLENYTEETQNITFQPDA